MDSGINIWCKKLFGQFLITHNPYCTINNLEARELYWDCMNFIPLEPNVVYFISVQFRYMGGPCGVVGLNVSIKPDEVQTYEYETPFFVFSPGKLRRLQ